MSWSGFVLDLRIRDDDVLEDLQQFQGARKRSGRFRAPCGDAAFEATVLIARDLYEEVHAAACLPKFGDFLQIDLDAPDPP